ncbi:hypothetical protein A2393_01580 [Candidatus Woesebacteria bacterium RIFOXYB1_FULL_41_13]|nr:MAG: hypothetical protein A2393_01580 [Candidatus Woesebacteria bacterium RIFOXYB1_FULL_41_13]
MNTLIKVYFIFLLIGIIQLNVFCEDLYLTPEICAEDVIKKFEKNGAYKNQIYNEIKYKLDDNNLIFIDKDNKEIIISINSICYSYDKHTDGTVEIITNKSLDLFNLRGREKIRVGINKLKAYSLEYLNGNRYYLCSVTTSSLVGWYLIIPNKKIYFFSNLSDNVKMFYIHTDEYNKPKIVFTQIHKSGLDIFSLPYVDISYYLEFYVITNDNIVREDPVLWIWDKYILKPYGTADCPIKK